MIKIRKITGLLANQQVLLKFHQLSPAILYNQRKNNFPSVPGSDTESHITFSYYVPLVPFILGQFLNLSLCFDFENFEACRPFILKNAPQFGFN